MKKNKMMRLASSLLVAVLLTSSVISGTFAKYVTSGEAYDEARVAKWGVKINATGLTDTFKNEYDGTVQVGATADLDLVAPGTSGELTKITFTGTPEVSVKITYDADLDLTNWHTDYFPIVFTIDGTTYGIEGMKTINGSALDNEYADKAALEEAVEKVIGERAAQEYGPNKDLSTVTDDGLTVAWEWAFENNDINDTFLGDEAAEGRASKIKLTVGATVEQAD